MERAELARYNSGKYDAFYDEEDDYKTQNEDSFDCDAENENDLFNEDDELFEIDDSSFDEESELADLDMGYETDPAKLKIIFDNYKNSTGIARERAAGVIVQQLQRLIYAIAHKHFATYMQNAKNKPEEIEEMVSSAWCGVFGAIDAYDPFRASPSTYFYRPILHEMTEYINRFYHKSSSYGIRVRRRINDARTSLAEKGNRNPKILDLAYESGLKASQIRKALELEEGSNASSLEAAHEKNGDFDAFGQSSEAAYDSFSDPFNAICEKERVDILCRALDSLPAVQKDILCRRFGIGGVEKENYTTIFKNTGITTDRIKAMEQQALNRLRMNPDLRQNWKGGKANEIKEDLNFESVSLTPDSAAFSMMNALEEVEEIDF